MEDFSGKNVFVLGGTGTIGFEIAKMFCKKGAAVTIHGGHDRAKLKKCVSDLKELSGSLVNKKNTVRGIFEEFDGKRTDFISFVENSKSCKEAKKADVLCLCFGPFLQKKIIEMEAFEWEEITRLNYVLPALLIEAALLNMKKNQFGRIVVFGGTATEIVRGFYTNAAYGAAKTALCSLVKSTAIQHKEDGITCNAVLPGQVETPEMSNQEKNVYIEKKGFVRFVQVQEIVQCVELLADNKAITGTCINVDAGWTP